VKITARLPNVDGDTGQVEACVERHDGCRVAPVVVRIADAPLGNSQRLGGANLGSGDIAPVLAASSASCSTLCHRS